MISFFLNGEKVTASPGQTLFDLLTSHGLIQKKIAVEIDGAIIPRGEFRKRIVENNDRIEIVTAVGGG